MNAQNINTGKTIKLLRKMKGVTQEEVAKALALTQQAYSKIEKQPWIENQRIESILVALKSSRKELETIKKVSRELS
jgi:transcriptional regulator with XRE-family HTH domain